MKRGKMTEVLGNIDPKLIEEAEDYKPKAHTAKRYKWVAAAACLLIAAAGAVTVPKLMGTADISNKDIVYAPVPDPNGEIIREEIPEVFPEHPILKPGDDGYIDPGTPLPIGKNINGSVEEKQENISIYDSEARNISNTPTVDCSLIEWNGKRVSSDLYEFLEQADDGEKCEISAAVAADLSFVYEGKTIEELFSDMERERMMPEKLMQLKKEGEYLKYGTDLCEKGAPDGMKWARELYEERVAFYGEELLGKYIVNGELLSELLDEDIEKAKNEKKAAKLYKAAYAAYLESIGKGLPYEGTEIKGESRLLLRMTKGEFREFTAANIGNWAFYRNIEAETSDDGSVMPADMAKS